MTTRPERMQEVHAVIRRDLPACEDLTSWRLGYHRFFVLLFAWLTLLPTMGLLPHISHTFDIFILLYIWP